MKRRKKESIYQTLADEAQKAANDPHRPEQIDLGAILSRFRRDKNLSGVELCRRAGDLDPRTLTAIEKGRIKNPSIRTLQSLSRGLGMTVSDLFRHAEVGFERFCCQGSKKGIFQIDLPHWGVKFISFTPFIKELFCGKMILGPRKNLDGAVLKHPAPIFVSALIGRVEVSAGKKEFILKEGENLFFNGILEHKFYNPLHRESALLIVTAPSFL